MLLAQSGRSTSSMRLTGAGAEYHPYATDSGYADMMDSRRNPVEPVPRARTRVHADGRDVQYKLRRVSRRSERRDEPR